MNGLGQVAQCRHAGSLSHFVAQRFESANIALGNGPGSSLWARALCASGRLRGLYLGVQLRDFRLPNLVSFDNGRGVPEDSGAALNFALKIALLMGHQPPLLLERRLSLTSTLPSHCLPRIY